VTGPVAGASPRRLARIAGARYLVNIIGAPSSSVSSPPCCSHPPGIRGRQHPGARAALPVRSRRVPRGHPTNVPLGDGASLHRGCGEQAPSGSRHPWRVRPVPPNRLRDPSTQTRDNPISAPGGIVGWVACSAQFLSALKKSGRVLAKDREPASRSSPERGFT
jgi:hypothetical protein